MKRNRVVGIDYVEDEVEDDDDAPFAGFLSERS